MRIFQIVPNAVLDYDFDWNDYLEAGEIIGVATVTPNGPGITVAPNPAINAGIVKAWLSAGTVNTTHLITCHIETSMLRTDERTALVQVVPRR